MELSSWRRLSDRGPDLVLCLDFPGGRASAGFPDLAASSTADVSFLHVGRIGAGPLDEAVARWTDEALAGGGAVRAVLGYCAGASLATCVADAVAERQAAPRVLLFDAARTGAGSLAGEFGGILQSSAEHLTEQEREDAQALADTLVEEHPDDLPRVADALAARYDELMRSVATRLSLDDYFRGELVKGFRTYLDYLLLASAGRFGLAAGEPLFVHSRDYPLPVDGDVHLTVFDVEHEELLRDDRVRAHVATHLRGVPA
ncbi:hypothetical protein ACQPYE_25630 [Actinosynnema sp. CA-299493]